ncbi:MAG: ferrous iron transport protein B [Methanoregulaceae archaeon]|nr:ferrous iron transport protein B [Methanoregulaceae archaeon]
MKYVLIGNPNVGKSLIFNHLTGLGVEVSNYPGTTVDICQGSLCYKGARLELVDLPGVYSIDGTGEEERLVRDVLLQGGDQVLIFVADASHLERNLYLFAQVAEFGLPMVLLLNMSDEAEKKGIFVNTDEISRILGIEVIPTVAGAGRNLDLIIPAALASPRIPTVDVEYDHHIEAAERTLAETFGVNRPPALLALQGISEDAGLLASATALSREIEEMHHMSARQIIATNRHNYAERIFAQVLRRGTPLHGTDFDRLLTSPMPGIPLMILILAGILFVVFSIGSLLEGVIVGLFQAPPFTSIPWDTFHPLVAAVGSSVLLALEAGIGIAFPFVFLFYILVSLLEDSGYLTRAAFLADRTMHRFGMHGQAIVPMVLGLGCNVPAVMSIRMLATKRERFIAAFLVTMVPCSARTVIIAGLLAAFVGLAAAFSVYVAIFILIILTGVLLSRVAPGEQFGMILEMAPLRMPNIATALKRSWQRIREFLAIAFPLLVVSSIALGVLQFYGAFDRLSVFLTPVSTGIFGLPPYAFTALIFGILRKEMTLGTLVVLAGTPDLSSVLTGLQLYTFAIMSVLFIPCISTMAVLYRQLGIKTVILVSLYTIFVGLAIAALIHSIGIIIA